MNVKRGDVVLVDFPFSAGGGAKVRPALIVQNDHDNRRLANTIIAQITSRTERALQEATQLLILLSTEEGKQSGLKANSCINCLNLYTLHKQQVLKIIGSLPDASMSKVNDCLRASLDLI